jgi:hypothetical protein
MTTTHSNTSRRPLERRSSVTPAVPWRLLGLGTGVLGGEGATMWLHPIIGEAMVATDLAIPTVVGLILLVAILRGDDVTCARAFRLLRWIANRPEPRGPGQSECERCYRHQTGLSPTLSGRPAVSDEKSNAALRSVTAPANPGRLSFQFKGSG